MTYKWPSNKIEDEWGLECSSRVSNTQADFLNIS